LAVAPTSWVPESRGYNARTMTLGALAARLTLYERLMRLDKPIGTLLLLWPTLWALWLASDGRPNGDIVWIFVLGTFLMRSAGCVMNDLYDWRFDAEVKRTRNRPLATGEVSRREGYALAAVLTLAAFVLVLFLNRLTVLLSFVALALAATYPLTKRFLAIPQAYLGIAFGFGIPMAYAAVLDELPAEMWWLLLANIVWAIAYDTEYAMVDRDDDVRIGIKTAAITLGRFDVAAVMVCYGVTLALLAGIGAGRGLGVLYYAGLTGAAALMGYHFRLIRSRDRDGCFKAFNQNNWVGAAIFAGMFADFAARQGLPWE
jgi:4-hydroxybenzoate polyprenyltransferase